MVGRGGWGPQAAVAPAEARFGDLAAEQASRTFAGRSKELALLLETLSDGGPAVIYLHGIAGIGKSRLISAFAERARNQNASVVCFDCRSVEPTEHGFLRALGARLGRYFSTLEDAVKALGAIGSRVVLALDHYEVLRLLDSWLRQSFIPRLPRTVRVILADREAPVPSWAAEPGWQGLFRTLELDALSAEDATALLGCLGIPEPRAVRVNRVAQGHPLALTLAAASLGKREDPGLEDLAMHRVIHELTRLYLAEIPDPVTRSVLDAACVLRRATISLLRAMLPDLPPQDAFLRLQYLPFVHIDLDGLHVHDAVKQVVATNLRATDPTRYRDHRRAAWSQLRAELTSVPTSEFWRYTADMLYLLENPAVREAFFPTGAHAYSVEPARPQDGETIRSICARHEGQEALRSLSEWWAAAPNAFSVVRDRGGRTVGFYYLAISDSVPPTVQHGDAVIKSWMAHLRKEPLAENETALFIRRWLSEEEGEQPSAIQAAIWIDIKRVYLALRPKLRRVYLTLRDIGPYAVVAQKLGFSPVTAAESTVDGSAYHTALLDFGPASVDGWLARLVAAELGVTAGEMLDVQARELVIDDARVKLTKLEFAVLRYLREREGKAVGREDLIRDVWGRKFDVGSNVVDAVIKTLRKKLGRHCELIETVQGFGYKFKAA